MHTPWPNHQVSEVQVLVNDVDGALLERFHGDELPVVVDVLDGQAITVLESHPMSWSFISTVRVTPELTGIDMGVWGTLQVPVEPCEVGEPMRVTFDIPAVVGATEYKVDLGGKRTEVSEPGLVEVDVQGCLGDWTFDVLITARGGGAILAYESLLGIEYAPGEDRSVDVDLADAPREVLQIDLTSLAGAERVAADAYWSTVLPDPPFVEREDGLELLDTEPADAVSFHAAVIAPGFGQPHAHASARFPGDGIVCHGAGLSRRGSSEEPIQLDATALRLAVPVDGPGLTWAWDGDGVIGDTIHRAWKIPSPDEEEWRELRWTVVDDPAAPPERAVFPELPADLPPDFLRPGGDPELVSIHHSDEGDVATYAEAMAAGVTPVEQTSWWRSSFPCGAF